MGRCPSCHNKTENCKCLNEYKKKKEDKSTCSTGFHFTNLFFDVQCGEGPHVIFEDFTDNHNKTMITANRGGFGFITSTMSTCTPVVIVETRNKPPITKTIPSDGSIGFQVENLKRVLVDCQGGTTGESCFVSITIATTFCICCP